MIIVCSSCIREVEYVFDDDISRTAITCVLENGTDPVVKVFNTNSINDSLDYVDLKDATVSITRGDGESYELTFDPVINAFISGTMALAGWNYELEVRISDVVYTAATSIPSKGEIYQASYTYGKHKDEYGMDLTHCEITLLDDSLKENYYQLFLINYENSPPAILNFYGYKNISNPVLVTEALLEYEPEFFLFSDANSEQGMIKIEFNNISFSIFNGKPGKTQIVVRSVSKEYYKFLRSWIVHSYKQNNGQHVNVIDDLDPYRIFFQGQPVELYSNIENGVGVFGAYTESRKFFTYVE
ncbi:MAG: DUF4249 domain-containing protein [Bacteroidales bacterium]|nr:DUF4249 domain-containing protein [Bacteroidales bacterium]